MENHLPKSWCLKPIVELLSCNSNGRPFQQGWSPQCENHPADVNSWGVLKTTAIQDGNFLDFENKKLPENVDPRPHLEVLAGDILMTCAGPRNRCGIVSFVKKTRSKLLMSGKMYRFRPDIRLLNAKYLEAFIRSYDAQLAIDSMKTGISDSGLNLTHGRFSELLVPFAPLNEQKRIVTKIEELFSELDSGITSLKTAQEKLKVYRQAVLKHAFEGKLTAQWRKENKNKLETPEQLLARIQQEREERYQEQLAEWEKAVEKWEESGKEGKKPSKPAKLKASMSIVSADFEIPTEWALSELAGVAYESVLGKMLDNQKNVGKERPYLGNINVRWGQIDLNQLKLMKIEDSEISRYSLISDDLIICEGGEPGRCAIWKGDDNVMFVQKALHRVRFTDSYLSKFAFYYLTYAVPLERVIQHFTGTTIKHLTGEGLSKVQLPICSLSEQKEIISLVEKKLSEIDKLYTELDTQIAKAEILRQSILKKAFSGQLVPQDPNDEPASELLARIQAEKAAIKEQAKPAPVKRGRKVKDTANG